MVTSTRTVQRAEGSLFPEWAAAILSIRALVPKFDGFKTCECFVLFVSHGSDGDKLLDSMFPKYIVEQQFSVCGCRITNSSRVFFRWSMKRLRSYAKEGSDGLVYKILLWCVKIKGNKRKSSATVAREVISTRSFFLFISYIFMRRQCQVWSAHIPDSFYYSSNSLQAKSQIEALLAALE